ncbi:MAG: DUF4190 domain-containing protein [Phycisphaerae bacterium]|nr:DUF4190 domain-containing protein [Phycisphaerae bacterium]
MNRWSSAAIASLILSVAGVFPLTFFGFIPAAILGHIALHRIAASEGRLKGRKLAMTSLGIAYTGIVLYTILMLVPMMSN